LKRLLIGSLVGLGALWLAFRGQDFGLLAAAVSRAHAGWVWAALASVGASLAVVTIRWRILFGRGVAVEAPAAGPTLVAPSLWSLFAALILGQATNITLPIRVGELLRVYVASRAGRVPVSAVLATVVVERLSDMMMLALGAAVLVLYVALPDWLVGPTRALAISGAVAGGIIAVVVVAGGRISGWIQTRVAASAGKSRTMQRIAHHGAMAMDEATNLRDWRILSGTGALSVAILALSASTNYLLFRAFDIPLPFVAAVLLLLVLTVGTAPVSTPGNLGVFQYLTILALAIYGVNHTEALAYSVVLYAIALGPKLILGVVVLAIGMRQQMFEPGLWKKLRGGA
jgi:glycosyltransferase 2 family protein